MRTHISHLKSVCYRILSRVLDFLDPLSFKKSPLVWTGRIPKSYPLRKLRLLVDRVLPMMDKDFEAVDA